MGKWESFNLHNKDSRIILQTGGNCISVCSWQYNMEWEWWVRHWWWKCKKKVSYHLNSLGGFLFLILKFLVLRKGDTICIWHLRLVGRLQGRSYVEILWGYPIKNGFLSMTWQHWPRVARWLWFVSSTVQVLSCLFNVFRFLNFWCNMWSRVCSKLFRYKTIKYVKISYK